MNRHPHHRIVGIAIVGTLLILPATLHAGDTAAPPAAAAGAAESAAGTGAAPGSAAVQGGGSANPSQHTGRRSLQDAMKECEGLSGSAAAKCQERALYAHPGEED
jgi:hypothetical protein